MVEDWNLSVLCLIHKEGDPTVSANYREISLLNITYMVHPIERIVRKPSINKLIGPYDVEPRLLMWKICN